MAGSSGPLTSGSLHTGVPRGVPVTSDQLGPAGTLRGSSSGPVPVDGRRLIPPLGNNGETPPFEMTPLADRKVEPHSSTSSFMAEPANLPPAFDSGEIDVEGGGKIIFSRTNGDNLMTAQDELLSKIHEKEESGELNRGSTKKLKKFFGGLKKVFGAVISSKKFQTCVGIIGIGVFIAAACVNPILLMGTVPFLVIFANGIIEEPMQAFPPTNSNNNQPPARKEGGDTDSGKKANDTKSTDTKSTNTESTSETSPVTNPDDLPPPPPLHDDENADDFHHFSRRRIGSDDTDRVSVFSDRTESKYGDDRHQFPFRRFSREDADSSPRSSYRTDDNSPVFPHQTGGEDTDDFSMLSPTVDGDDEFEGGRGWMAQEHTVLRSQHMRAELEDAEELAQTMWKGMADEGVEGSTVVIPRPLADGVLRKMNISDFASSAPEKPVSIEQYVRDEILAKQPDLQTQLLQSCREQGKEGTDDKIINGLIKDLEARVKFMAPLYNKSFPDLTTLNTLSHLRDRLKQQRFPVPDPADWIKIQNLLTKNIVKQLVEDATVRGSVLQFKSASSFKASSEKREIMADALEGIGLPYQKENTEKPINRVGIGYCREALNYWTEGLMRNLFPEQYRTENKA